LIRTLQFCRWLRPRTSHDAWAAGLPPRQPRARRRCGALAALILLVAAQGGAAQEIRYIYDKLGRLVGVVDAQGRTAIYEYDPVGNLLAIRRQDATGPVAITFVNPNQGTFGTRVEIFGIGFSPVAANNQVSFNGVAAVVVSAANSSLTTSVPVGATSGPITVTTPLGSATAPAPFTVLIRSNAAADFSPSSNPNGAWSYGWSSTLGSAFNLDVARASVSGIDLWRGNLSSDGNPSVSHNSTANVISIGTVTWQPRQLAFHPGPNGEFSVIRWTAPTTAIVSIAASFTGADCCATTTDVHVLRNGVSLFDNSVIGFGTTVSFSATVSIQAGDTIDFIVGFGSDGNFFNDTTGLDAVLSEVTPAQ